MAFDLRPDEIRVLGVLIEKQLSVPESYPMTINAILVGCNQKSNRDPVTAFTESEISTAVSSLRRRSLVDQAPPERNSRSIRFLHLADKHFGWNAAQRAIMSELMVRGPQTLGELRTHAARMTYLESLDYARELLGELEKAEPSLVMEMEREPGRREPRWAQLLGGMPTTGTMTSTASKMPLAALEGPAATIRHADPLEERIGLLEKKVSDLEERLASLEKQLGS